MILSTIKLARQNLMVCLAVLWACGSVSAEKQSAAESVRDLMRRGVSAENSHRTANAAEAYEKLLQRDTTFEATVAPRLVNLYLSMNQPAPALSWATRIARRHPAPKAYLAGVYARMGQHKEAELMLRQAIRNTPAAAQRVPLQWQLAEAQEHLGEEETAKATLEKACRATENNDLRKTSAQRLTALRKRLAARHAKQTAAPRTPAAEETL